MQYLIFIFSFIVTVKVCASETITFKSEDGLEITADAYMPHGGEAPFIILFHQANWSRGEYLEIAPRLNALGYNCLAVDLRSGGKVNGITNQTKANAVKEMKETRYIDALPDIRASIAHVRDNYNFTKLVILGSSYSAGLVLQVAGEYPGIADGVVAFSPGEYFGKNENGEGFVVSSAQKITRPVFITSSRNEKPSWQGIYEVISVTNKNQFLPQSLGNHGAKALWKKFTDSKDYWQALVSFLKLV